MRGMRSTKRRGVVSRKAMSRRCGSVTMGSGAPTAPATSSSQTARQCCTRRICNWGIARSVSNKPSSVTSAPVVNSVIPPSNQSGAFMCVSVVNVKRRKLGAALAFPPKRETGRETGGPPPSYMDSVKDSSLEEGLRRRLRTWRISLRRPARRSVRIRDATKRSSDAASGWNPSANEEDEKVLLPQLMRISTCTGSGDERSIMACAQKMERSGLITDQSSRRPSAAERQYRQT